MRDNLFLAVRGTTRGRFNMRRPPHSDPSVVAAEALLRQVRLEVVGDTLVASLSHGQQRQLEVGMALAGAPRLILFDEPAAGLSPAERRELVALLRALPRHLGFVLIEHDLDIALGVAERVTVMHNGRVLKHGSPQEIQDDAEVHAIYMGAKGHPEPCMSTEAINHLAPALEVRNLDVYYGRAHALQDVSLTLAAGVLGVVGRNGMGKTTLCNAITGLVSARGSVKLAGREILGCRPT